VHLFFAAPTFDSDDVIAGLSAFPIHVVRAAFALLCHFLQAFSLCSPTFLTGYGYVNVLKAAYFFDGTPNTSH